jgi:hypothetical protein
MRMNVSFKWRLWHVSAFLVLLFVSVGCSGPSLPGKIEYVQNLTDDEATAMVKYDKYLYIATQAGKLLTYDVSNPAEPKALGQTDSFAGPHIGMAVASGGQSLVLLGKSGKITVFDIGDNPGKPSGIWGRGKTFQLPGKMGPFIMNDAASAMYMTPGGGKALMRIDISAFLLQDLSKLKASEVTRTIDGGGGGGIRLVTDNNGSPVRLYIGNKDTGKLDIWMVADIEGGKAKPAPVASAALKVGKDVSGIMSFKENAQSVDEWLVITSSKSTEDVEILDLGRYWKSASDPKSLGVVTINGLLSIEPTKNYLVTKELTVYDFSKRGTQPISEYLKEPVKMAELELRQDIEIRSMVTVGDYVFTAEVKGLRVYKITAGKADAAQ